MTRYQSIFTRVQVQAPVYPGIPLEGPHWPRVGKPRLNYWLGIIGDAQIGPVYLGWLGLASLLCGFIAIEIIGLNMWASVDWNPIQFVRQLPWLALEPPPPAYGLHLPPLNEGGWWIMTGFFLTAAILLWWARMYTRARALGLGTHVAWAFASARLPTSTAAGPCGDADRPKTPVAKISGSKKSSYYRATSATFVLTSSTPARRPSRWRPEPWRLSPVATRSYLTCETTGADHRR